MNHTFAPAGIAGSATLGGAAGAAVGAGAAGAVGAAAGSAGAAAGSAGLSPHANSAARAEDARHEDSRWICMVGTFSRAHGRSGPRNSRLFVRVNRAAGPGDARGPV